MRLSQGFWQTYKEVPADAVIPSHRLMLRAGLILKTAAGLYSYLPMGYRVIRKIEGIVREEMDKADSHELLCPFVTPGELWKESDRWDKMEGLMLKAKDRLEKDVCLSPTNEETMTDIFRKSIHSYKQLPTTLYQINTKYRDEIRPRFGLMRAREFIMKDAYSFDLDKESLDQSYQNQYQAYEKILERLGLEFMAVEADAGAMADGDQKTHEFQVLAQTGEDTLIVAKDRSYAANLEKAQTKRADQVGAEPQEQKRVQTKDKSTIEQVCDFLKTPQGHSLKALVYHATFYQQKGVKEKLIGLLVLGDDELNEIKLKNFLGCDLLQPANEKSLQEAGLVLGYIGPESLEKAKIDFYFDTAVDLKRSYTVGAGEKDYHYIGHVPARDCDKKETADLRSSKAGDLTLNDQEVEVMKGIEVGHVFQLGDKYTKTLKATVLDQSGRQVTPLMGCYGIGVSRIMAAAVEQQHDEKGIIWPYALAPYHVYLVVIGKSPEIKQEGENLYDELKGEFEVILDDRKSAPGVKFNDADLLGLPFIITLGERDFKTSGQVEIKIRKSGKAQKIARQDLLSTLQKLRKTEFGL